MIGILYEDNHLLAAAKPAGMLTQETDLEPESLCTLLKAQIKERDKKPGGVFLHPVHRLDRPVSGIVLFAKSSKALSRLNEALRGKMARKIYVAKVEGTLPDEGELTHFLLKKEHRTEVVVEGTPEAKEARLKFRRKGDLYEIELITGRYHQIRAQLAAVGAPILGDVKYGAKSRELPGIALHHAELHVIHPVTKELLVLRFYPSW